MNELEASQNVFSGPLLEAQKMMSSLVSYKHYREKIVLWSEVEKPLSDLHHSAVSDGLSEQIMSRFQGMGLCSSCGFMHIDLLYACIVRLCKHQQRS